MDINSLDRFIEAQEKTYQLALAEIKNGRKCSHWMWYIFPQLRGLGVSHNSYVYGISGIDEAKEYLSHPVLSARLIEISELLLTHSEKSARYIFGEIDEMKLRSSMTLFAYVSEEGSVFHRVLETFFDGKRDGETLMLLGVPGYEVLKTDER